MKLAKKIVSFVLVGVLLLGILVGCKSDTDKSFNSADDFGNAKIGVMTGSSFDILAKEYYPEAKRMYYLTIADMIMSLKQDKIDGILLDKAFFTPLAWEDNDLFSIEMDMPVAEYGIAFGKSEKADKLKVQINEFIRTRTESGWLSELEGRWFSASEPEVDIDMSRLSCENGIIRIATDVGCKPFDYLKDGKLYGYDVEFIYNFAEEYGYGLEVDIMDFASILPSMSTDRYDLAIASITVTDERRESVDFSDIYYRSPVVMAVLEKNTSGISDVSDFEDASLGVVTGSIFDAHSKTKFSDAKVSYYQTFADLFQCVQQGRIDGFMADEPNYNSVKRVSPTLASMKVPGLSVEIGYGFQKNADGAKLKAEMDSFINELKSDGTIDTLIDKWYGDIEPVKTLEKPDFSDNNTTLSVAIDTGRKPFVYMLNNGYAGFETEVMYMFCEKYGYNPIISDVPFASGITGLAGGKFDLVAGGLYITEERKKSINFSQPYMYADVVMVYCTKEAKTTSFLDDFKMSFERTFIREDRWKLICEGIGVTMLISVLSVIFGSILGFLLYLMSRSERKSLCTVARLIGKIYSRIVAGTPVVVILMILFYLVFAEFKNLSGIVIAVVGFSITFGAFVYDHMTVSVGSVDYGQTEAALALGYSRNQAFFRIVLPQAMTIFMPSYCGEVVGLIKATAVVGYIAVNDLTKMGDIIRSNTYEAFFPLISTAVIYFVVTWIVASLLNVVKLKFEPKRRSKKTILKGVENDKN